MNAQYRTPLMVVGGLFALWGVIGLFDMGNIPYSGYLTGPDYTVTRIDAGSPAEAAGLAVGDRITHIDDVSIEDTPALTRMPRAEIGETRVLSVETAGMTLAAGDVEAAPREVGITFSGLPARDIALTWAGLIIGLCFIGFGLLAYTRAPSRASLLLALTGLCLGIAFVGGPYIASYALRTIVGAVILMLIVLGFATLLHCLAEFPKAKAILQRPHMIKVLYAPAVLLALFFLWTIVFEPQGTSTLNNVVNMLAGIFVVGYFGLTLVALIHSYVTATPEERSKYGLNLMLLGVVVGLLPVMIPALVSIFAPSVVLPGVDFYFVTMILIPITLALAVMRSAEPAAPVPAM